MRSRCFEFGYHVEGDLEAGHCFNPSCRLQGHPMQGEGRLIRIGDRGLFARVRGSGPVVVLSSGRGTAGVGAWDPIEPAVARLQRS